MSGFSAADDVGQDILQLTSRLAMRAAISYLSQRSHGKLIRYNSLDDAIQNKGGKLIRPDESHEPSKTSDTKAFVVSHFNNKEEQEAACDLFRANGVDAATIDSDNGVVIGAGSVKEAVEAAQKIVANTDDNDHRLESEMSSKSNTNQINTTNHENAVVINEDDLDVADQTAIMATGISAGGALIKETDREIKGHDRDASRSFKPSQQHSQLHTQSKINERGLER